ncbi:hypothetical protein POY79_02555 [Phocaeicola vulgatus]|nr:hypothetical protein [Phocaeicola vulgatus]MDB1013717.1 hypothetical protein [Phocaeicola vulgatus]MDB1023159.1 hypothetical protein [Phocaeicola vulgatus]MDC1566490.1 hypothetical protein [Phocaeicola vulgatus]MDC1621159.1 hypothetical protein [Phocaeicola vulgatus]MDC1629945.1 hypothetical protein [Phocaeicola vulgatus]
MLLTFRTYELYEDARHGILFRGTVLPEDLPAAVLQPALAVVMVF